MTLSVLILPVGRNELLGFPVAFVHTDAQSLPISHFVMRSYCCYISALSDAGRSADQL